MDPQLQWLLLWQEDKERARDTSDWARKLEIVTDECHPKQRAFATDPGERIVALVGGRGGKTTGAKVRLLRRMMTTPGANCLFIAPTRGQAEQLLWAQLKKANERLGFGAPKDVFSESKLTMTLPRNGAQLFLVGADDKAAIETLRGIPRHEVIIDEAGSYAPRLLKTLIEEVLEARLGDYNGTLVLIGTPARFQGGLFYDYTSSSALVPRGDDLPPLSRPWADRELPEYADFDGWSLHRWSKQDGAPFVPEIANAWAAALRIKKRNGWTDEHPVWRREHLGEWAADDTERISKYRPHLEDGTPWNEWAPEMDRSVISEGFAKLPNGEWSYVYGCDLGYSDSFALDVFAWREHDSTLYHCCCIDRKRMYAQQMAILLLGQEWVTRITAGKDPGKPGGLVGITGWPVGAVADNSGKGQALLDELSHVYGFKFKAADRTPGNKHDSIELANGDLIEGRAKFIKGSKLAEQALDLQWAVDDYGKLTEPRGKPNDHHDAWVYARGEAAHLFAQDEPAPKAETRTAAAVEQARRQRLDVNEEQAARERRDEFEYEQPADDFWG